MDDEAKFRSKRASVAVNGICSILADNTRVLCVAVANAIEQGIHKLKNATK